MKKGIAALVIAAAMISIPGTLNATSFFDIRQNLGVVSQEVNPQATTYSIVVYKFLGENDFRNSGYIQGSWFFPYDISTGQTLIAYLYDYEEQRYTDAMVVTNYKQ